MARQKFFYNQLLLNKRGKKQYVSISEGLISLDRKLTGKPFSKSRMFYNHSDRLKINQWLMGQMGYIGPMLGQHHQFHHYNPGKSEFGEKRYFKILAAANKKLLPSFTKKRLDLSRASQTQLLIFGWRLYVTKRSLD